MSSIMLDLEKIQVALSNMLADFLRQSFTALALLAVVLQTDWKLAVVSLTVLPFVLVPTLRLGRRIRRTTRAAQDNAAELNQVCKKRWSGHQVATLAREDVELEPLPRSRGAAAFHESTLRRAAGDCEPGDFHLGVPRSSDFLTLRTFADCAA